MKTRLEDDDNDDDNDEDYDYNRIHNQKNNFDLLKLL